VGHGITLRIHGAKIQTTTWTGTRKARKETKTLAKSYVRQQLHGGAVSGETAPPSSRTPAPPGLSGNSRARSQLTRSPATTPSEQKHARPSATPPALGEQARSPGTPLAEANQAHVPATSPDEEEQTRLLGAPPAERKQARSPGAPLTEVKEARS